MMKKKYLHKNNMLSRMFENEHVQIQKEKKEQLIRHHN